MVRTRDQNALEVIRSRGIVRPSDLGSVGITRTQVHRLYRRGLIEQASRGLYFAKDHDLTENHSLAVVAKRVPTAVICLLSALQFHDIGTQCPFEVWITLPNNARHPSLDYPQIRVMRASGEALSAGIEVHRFEGVDIRVYTSAKTVVDCFKYRNKIGIAIGLEAMWDGWRRRRYTMAEIDKFSRICRVSRVMHPYLQAMLA